MKQVLIDTNAMLRFLLNDIPSQANQVENLLLEASKGKIEITVTQFVISEIIYAFQKYYHFPKIEIINAIKTVLSMNYIDVEDGKYFHQALKIYEGASISFVDCFLIAKVSIDEKELFTFDKKLKKVLGEAK